MDLKNILITITAQKQWACLSYYQLKLANYHSWLVGLMHRFAIFRDSCVSLKVAKLAKRTVLRSYKIVCDLFAVSNLPSLTVRVINSQQSYDIVPFDMNY